MGKNIKHGDIYWAQMLADADTYDLVKNKERPVAVLKNYGNGSIKVMTSSLTLKPYYKTEVEILNPTGISKKIIFDRFSGEIIPERNFNDYIGTMLQDKNTSKVFDKMKQTSKQQWSKTPERVKTELNIEKMDLRGMSDKDIKSLLMYQYSPLEKQEQERELSKKQKLVLGKNKHKSNVIDPLDVNSTIIPLSPIPDPLEKSVIIEPAINQKPPKR